MPPVAIGSDQFEVKPETALLLKLICKLDGRGFYGSIKTRWQKGQPVKSEKTDDINWAIESERLTTL